MSGVVHGGRLSLPLRARGDEKAAVVLACSEESNLKAFLLAAGHGTRLRPLTDKIPKCLLPIRGIPMLQIWLEACSYFGIEEVLVNIHAHAEAVHEFLRSIRIAARSEWLKKKSCWAALEPC
jgi:UTP-glucose-1-phosphate uridylyltransferase